ncbi:leucine-rich repeat domain-containing protein [Flavobacterium hydrophilum]|uniref:Disease resistance R13L4/SHOC-2-like LRR domain-containing protein n=1 Tax=Flavobacterium hydrophilum TaxID=2211445 RepID=A0A2V4CAN1_9FLAO|nr:hypothetical protein [Flavobacterium hydrophilum]PXY47010.1 hypothetical protein DMB68_07645 [Flavobacterium hydrophilum]
MNEKELTIDLSKEKFNFSELLNLNEITSIRFDNYTDKIEIPSAINEYPNITELSFYGDSKEYLFETPDNLEKLIHIKKLILWSYCDFSKIKPMVHLEKLDVVVKNTEADTRNIVALFPNLKYLEIWGDHLKNQNLPDEIENLKSLESLHLVSCGLGNLPKSFVNLKQLTELNLRGLPMNTFPEEITQLENLEILEISQSLAKLPDSLSNLKNLRKLNLNSALNGANMDVAGSFFNEKIYLKPIPEVIGKLENLEDLNLAICGVFDITPILPLRKLKKLNLQYSALKNCNGFSNFKMLEELNLSTSYDLINIDGLNSLPLKKLNLYSCHSESIAVISSLAALEELHIRSCNYIRDFSPLYSHSGIKKLKANEEILKKWKKREQYNKLPELDLIIAQLQTNDLDQFEEAILHLSKHVKANSNEEQNPLAGFFGIKTRDEEITEIEILDAAIQKHLKNLSDKTLVTIFAMTFKTVGFDNYNAALIVLNEIIARKNIETQKKIIKKFYKACKYYDAGHRFWSYTVHDQLIDNLFAQFTSEALYELLKKASTDMLNSEGGDQMEELFIPAFQNAKDEQLQEKLLNVFFEYEKEARTYYGKSYFDQLLQQISDVGSAELQNLILKNKEGNKEPENWLTLLENLNEENFPAAIDQFVSKTTENINESDFKKITSAAKEIILPESNLIVLLNLMIKERNKNDLPGILIFQYHKKTPEKIIDFLKAKLEKNIFDTYDVTEIAKRIIKKLCESNTPLSELEIYENFMITHCDMSFDQIYNIEIDRFLYSFFHYLDWHWVDSRWTLEKAKAVALKIKGEIRYSDLRSQTYGLVDSGKYETAKEVFEILHSKIKYSENEGTLFYNIIAATKLNDEPYFDLLYKEVQKIEKISEVLLAYNLACGFAHFGRKEKMLIYIKESIRLGKIKQQFLDDTDFEKYWADADFLKVIEEK